MNARLVAAPEKFCRQLLCRSLVLLAFLLSAQAAWGGEKVRLQLKWRHAFQFAGYYAAQAQGYYQAAGLDVEIVPAQPGQDPEQQVIQGKADFGVGATDLLLFREKGAPVVVLASIFQHSPLAFMALRTSGLQTVQDLAGAKVMIEPDHAELFAYLRSEGIATEKLTQLPHSYDVQDLISGKVGAMSVYVTDEPFLLRQAGRDYQLYSPRAVGIDFYSDNLFTTESLVRTKPELVKKFREASLKGWDYAMHHQPELVRLIYSQYSQQRSVEHLQYEARQMEALLQPSVIEIGHMNPGRWRNIAEVYAEMGMLKRDFNLKGFLYDPNPAPPDLTWLYFSLIAVVVLLVMVTLVAVRFARLSAALTRSNAELERTQKALRLKNLVFDSSLAANNVADLNGVITEANDMFLRVWGYTSRDEVIGKPAAHWFKDPAEAAAIIAALNQCGQWEGDFTGKRRDGTTFIGHTQATVVRDDRGSVIGYQSAVMDITERKRMEVEKEKLELQNRQLQKAESLSRMAGAIAHLFNNQLQAVMMSLEMSMMDLERQQKSTANLAAALEAARKAAEVSTLMLTYVGQAPVKGEPLDLSETCREALARQSLLLPAHVVLETMLPVPGPVIYANASQIQRLFANLLTNASEAGSEGRGAVRISVSRIPMTEIPKVHRFPLDWHPRDRFYACLEVADAGCGIATKDLEKIFDPFYSSKFTGRGMGLAVVLGVVRASHGVITVESQPGQGSSFRVYLPVSAEAVPAKPAATIPTPQTIRGNVLLLVEDEMVVREALADGLTQVGYTVLVAGDGVEAVEIFRQHPGKIGCVLCDLTMPRMNGWETLNALRQLSPGIPFILSSGYAEEYVMQGNHPERPQAFLSKPYEFKALLGAISKLLSV